MSTTYLKFTSEAEAIAHLPQFRSDDQWLTYKDGANLDVAGTIYKPTGVMITDFDGLQHPEMVRLDGFHVNLLSPELPENLLPFVAEPATPSRVFA